MHSGAPAAVAGVIDQLDLKMSQRLQLAATAAGLPLLLLRPARNLESSAAATRWRVGTAEAARDRFGLFARPRWHLQLERCRNGRPGEWVVEYDHVAHRFSLAAALADPALSRARRRKILPASRLIPTGRSSWSIAGAGGPRIAALNEAAEAAGLALGEPLADARAKADDLQMRAVDAAADDAALRRLALWATRYTPTASPWSVRERRRRFFPRHRRRRASVRRRGGVAGRSFLPARKKFRPAGTACRRRYARHGLGAGALCTHALPCSAVGTGKRKRSSRLPVEALRLSPETCATLRRLGFKSVGALLDKPRAPFAARFPAELLRRIDQALGRVDEPLVPIVAPPVYHTLRYLLEPIITQEAVVALASRLMQTLVHVLIRDDVGARALRLSPLSRRWRSGDDRYRADAADAQRLPCRAADRAQARSAGGDGRCRLRLRSDRTCRHSRRNHARAAERADWRTTAAMPIEWSVARSWSIRCVSGSDRKACGGSSPSPVTFPSAPKLCVPI